MNDAIGGQIVGIRNTNTIDGKHAIGQVEGDAFVCQRGFQRGTSSQVAEEITTGNDMIEQYLAEQFGLSQNEFGGQAQALQSRRKCFVARSQDSKGSFTQQGIDQVRSFRRSQQGGKATDVATSQQVSNGGTFLRQRREYCGQHKQSHEQ